MAWLPALPLGRAEAGRGGNCRPPAAAVAPGADRVLGTAVPGLTSTPCPAATLPLLALPPVPSAPTARPEASASTRVRVTLVCKSWAALEASSSSSAALLLPAASMTASTPPALPLPFSAPPLPPKVSGGSPVNAGGAVGPGALAVLLPLLVRVMLCCSGPESSRCCFSMEALVLRAAVWEVWNG